MTTYAQFDRSTVSAAVEAARNHYSSDRLDKAAERLDPLDDGHLSLAGGCISVNVADNKICLELPLGLGKVCVPIPVSIPNGTVAEACIRICSTWGIPHGLRLTITVAGHVILEKTFLKC